ncbi:naphthalene 1,2-dioxygenase [Ralstonia mannitolilytica]|uniref:2Fe-2S iron-sulfur cluster-binding protein n=1 Tax=Ralstonia mannitolilytica TaxID=105219 RepID=UPI0005DA2F25|nr:2Fe-2S iron-sulfur cluster-binding protein [Ralstonia mannitolilytica]AJW44642.1 naphthalene 1,2-dioxygenase [Ralstonia mannitolilytica]
MELVVQPLKLRLQTEIGKNLLDVLRAHSVPISYSCMSGRCGTCRCKVIEGSVLGGVPETGRPHSAKAGEVLACQATLTGDCTIEVPDVDEVVTHPAKIIKGTVTSIEQATHDIRRIKVKLAKPLEFSPGQYAILQFTPDHIRPYSMAGLPGDEEMEFHIRKVHGGRVTEYIFGELKVGSNIRISGPLGTAYLRRKHTGPMLCVGGGTGLAPVLSIVRGALAEGMTNPIHLYFGVRSQEDLYDAERLQAMADQHPQLKVHVVVATGPVDGAWRSGLVTDAIESDFKSLDGWRAYLCGAPAMVDALSLIVAKLGIASEHVHADAFYPSGV